MWLKIAKLQVKVILIPLKSPPSPKVEPLLNWPTGVLGAFSFDGFMQIEGHNVITRGDVMIGTHHKELGVMSASQVDMPSSRIPDKGINQQNRCRLGKQKPCFCWPDDTQSSFSMHAVAQLSGQLGSCLHKMLVTLYRPRNTACTQNNMMTHA